MIYVFRFSGLRRRVAAAAAAAGNKEEKKTFVDGFSLTCNATDIFTPDAQVQYRSRFFLLLVCWLTRCISLTPGPASKWIGDCLRPCKPTRYETSLAATQANPVFYPQVISSSLQFTGWRPSVPDWGGDMSAGCTTGRIVRFRWRPWPRWGSSRHSPDSVR